MDRYDLATIVGLVSLVVGLWLVAPWIALTVGGVVLVIIGLVGARIAEMTSAGGS